MITYIKSYNDGTKWMYFLIVDGEFLKNIIIFLITFNYNNFYDNLP